MNRVEEGAAGAKGLLEARHGLGGLEVCWLLLQLLLQLLLLLSPPLGELFGDTRDAEEVAAGEGPGLVLGGVALCTNEAELLRDF